MRPGFSLLILAAIAVSACGRGGTELLDPKPPGGNGSRDAGVVDTGPNPDSGSQDVPIVDTLPPPDSTLGEALACHMTDEEQLEAAVRYVACMRPDNATVSSYVEAFDAGLMGTFAQGVENFTGFPVRQGCRFWRCAAAATSCGEFFNCVPNQLPVCTGIEAGSWRCIDSSLSICNGQTYDLIADCAEFGASCTADGCRRSGCTFPTSESREPFCSDRNTRISVCEETLDMSCEVWQAGSSCQAFYVGGEVPVSWCSPTNEGVAGAYNQPVFCNMGGIFFEPVTRDAVSYGCLAKGYSDCDQRGCIE